MHGHFHCAYNFVLLRNEKSRAIGKLFDEIKAIAPAICRNQTANLGVIDRHIYVVAISRGNRLTVNIYIENEGLRIDFFLGKHAVPRTDFKPLNADCAHTPPLQLRSSL